MFLSSQLVCILFIVSLLGCHPGGAHLQTGGNRVRGLTVVSYDDVRPIFARNCSFCHPSRSGPDWLNYQQAKGYAANGGELERRAVNLNPPMPPPGSPQAAAITDDDRRMIGAWIQDGALEHGPVSKKPVANGGAEDVEVSSTVLQCLQCHGAQGPGPQAEPKIPRLGGQNEIYLETQLNAFEWRRRLDPSNAMYDVTRDLKPDKIREAARYFSRQPGFQFEAAPRITDPEIFRRGQELAAEKCVSCHMSPNTSDPSVPLLAGQSEQYLVDQLRYYRARERTNPLMVEYTRRLSDDDITALALFFSAH
jgi:cytochrome c553